jgi:hypothetical protein
VAGRSFTYVSQQKAECGASATISNTKSFSILCLVQSELILLTYGVGKAIGKNIKDFLFLLVFAFLVGKNLVSQDKREGIRVELWFSEGRHGRMNHKDSGPYISAFLKLTS